jgi:hypothetical protein
MIFPRRLPPSPFIRQSECLGTQKSLQRQLVYYRHTGKSKEVTPERSVTLAVGTKINFGKQKAKLDYSNFLI